MRCGSNFTQNYGGSNYSVVGWEGETGYLHYCRRFNRYDCYCYYNLKSCVTSFNKKHYIKNMDPLQNIILYLLPTNCTLGSNHTFISFHRTISVIFPLYNYILLCHWAFANLILRISHTTDMLTYIHY